MQITLKKLSLAIAGAGLLTIYGCGGGGSSDTPTAATPTPVTPTPESIASLPAALLSQPQSAHCAALRSGSYDLVVPTANATAASQIVDRGTVDAIALTLTDSSGTSNLVPTSEACHFTANNGVSDIVVSPSGVMVARVLDGNIMKLAIAVPTQTFTVADLAGTFNVMGMEANNGTYNGKAMTVTLNSGGVVTAAKQCSNATTWDVTNASCLDITTGLPTFTVNSAGGFNLVDSTGHINARMFAYKSGSGDVMFIMGGDGGGLNVFTKQRTNSLPTVGDTKTTWNLQLDNLLASPTAVSANSNTVVSVDSAAGSWVRSLMNAGSTVTHPETFLANNPRGGYSFRGAGSALASDGTTATISEVTTLNLNGMGLTATLIPSSKRFQFSVTQP